MQRFLSFGYLALIVGGFLLAIGSALSLTIAVEPFSAQVVTGTFVLSAGLRLLGSIAMIIGLTAVYVRQADRAGMLGLIAFVLVIGNMVLQSGWMWSDTFLAGAVAANAPGILDGSVQDPRLDVGFLTAWLLNATFVVFGIATLRARVFLRLCGWSLVVMGAITLVPLPVDGPVYEVVIGLAAVVAGLTARRVAGVPSEPMSAAPAFAG